jgi:Putative prokaryotic signal transducing protein
MRYALRMAVAGEDWTEIRRFDDPLQASMVKDFLEDHGVRVSVRGNAGATAVLNRFATVVDIRLDVPASEVEAAREALLAMDVGEASEQPFRGLRPPAPPGDDAAVYVAPRRAMTAMMLGFVVPIGSAHFYARHGAAGGILLAGIIGAGFGVVLGLPQLGLAWGLIALADIVGGYWAVKRFNAGRVPTEAAQRAVALLVVGASFVLAVTVAR